MAMTHRARKQHKNQIQQAQTQQRARDLQARPAVPVVPWRRTLQVDSQADSSAFLGLTQRELRKALPNDEHRPIRYDFGALRVYEAVLRRDGERALREDVARTCARMARHLLDEASSK